MSIPYVPRPLAYKGRQACEAMLTLSLFPYHKGPKNLKFEVTWGRGNGPRPVLFELRITILIHNCDYAVVVILRK